MSIVLIGLALVILNTVIGAAMWVAMDDDEENLLKWYSTAPEPQWFSQLLALNLWPWVLYRIKRGG
jgi:hypothetical protein